MPLALYHSLVMFSAWPGSCFNITLTLSHDAVFCLGCLFAYFMRYLQFHICTKIYKCTVSVCIFDSRSWSKFRLASRCTWISDSRDVSLQYMRVLQSQEVHKKFKWEITISVFSGFILAMNWIGGSLFI